MKIYYYTIAIASLLLMTLSACGSDPVTESGNDTDALPIRFEGGKTEHMTRANDTESPLSDYIKDFTVYGINGNLSNGSFTKNKGVAFPNYVVWYDPGSSLTNTDNWEYVGTLPTGDNYSTLSDDRNADISAQVIKYWDKTQNAHYFWAIGNASRGTFRDIASDGRVKSVSISNVKTSPASEVLYYTEPTLIKSDDATYGSPVRLTFRKMLSQIRFGFYEALEETTTDGNQYVIKMLMLYGKGSGEDKDAYGFSKVSPNGETSPCVMGSFPTDGGVTISYTYNEDGTGSSTAATTPNSTAAPTSLTVVQPEVSNTKPLATTSTNPTYLNAGEFYNVFPSENQKGITIKCDFKTYDNKNNKESDLQTKYATVPAEYCKWQSGYEYTYIFKISDNIFLTDVIINFQGEIQKWEETGQSNEDGKGTQGW